MYVCTRMNVFMCGCVFLFANKTNLISCNGYEFGFRKDIILLRGPGQLGQVTCPDYMQTWLVFMHTGQNDLKKKKEKEILIKMCNKELV